MTQAVQPLVDLMGCDTEPIRFPGAVQPHGALLVVEPGRGVVVAASCSIAQVLGQDAASVLGQPVASVLGAGEAASLLAHTGAQPLATRLSRPGRQPLLAQASIGAAGEILVDIEDAGPDALPAEQGLRRGLSRLRGAGDVDALAMGACEVVRSTLGFDRVMVYRFDTDWHGEVLGEARAEGLPSFLGLHFPASDIPRQARELYEQCRVRQIPDVDYVASTLMTLPGREAVDLSTSNLRSVSPVHIEYCRNMGVRATLVGSLVIDGRLWGLIACHHVTGPRATGLEVREAFGSFCEAVAGLVDTLRLRHQRARAEELAARRSALVDTVRHHDFRSLFQRDEGRELLDVVGADGFALLVNGSTALIGHTPDASQVRALDAKRLQKSPGATLVSSCALEQDFGPGLAADGIAGALFVSVPQKPRVTMIWFRDEHAKRVMWGGNPGQAHTVKDDGRISPRKSFARYLQEIRGQSLPWTAEERFSAADLSALIEIDALREREAFTKTILDSSPSHLCVLDPQGTIVTVNQAWERFALANGAGPETAAPLGINYLHICTAADGQASGKKAGDACRGVSDVLAGRRAYYTLDYPCDSPDERRWFQMSAYPMQAPAEGAVVLHTNITERKLAELALAASEQRYRAVLDGQTDLICRFGRDGTILYVNPAYCEYFGKPASQLVGNRWHPVVLPEDVPHVEAELAQLTPEQPVVGNENRVLVQGAVRWGHWINRAFFDDQRRLIEFQAVGRDITDRKAAEARIEALVREQTALLSSPVVGIVKVQDHRVSWANPALAAMFGYTVGELVGMPTRAFFDSDAAYQDFDAARQPALATMGTFEAETQLVRKDGSLGWFASSVAMLNPASGEEIAAMIDVSARKAAEARLERHRQELEEQVAARTKALRQAKDDAEAAMLELRRAHDRILLGKSTLDAALNSMSDAVMICDAQGNLLELNEGFARFHRFPDLPSCPRQLSEISEILELRTADGVVAPPAQWAFPRALRGEVGSDVEYRLRRKDTGEEWFGSYTFGPIHNAAGSIVGAVVVGRDVTESKAAQIDLQTSHAALQRLIAAQDRVQDEERARIAGELHDDLQQTLAAIRIDLGELQRRSPDVPADQRLLVSEVDALAAQAIQSVRRVVGDLRPKMLEDRSLAQALQLLGELFSRHSGIECDVQADDALGEALRGHPMVAGCLLRVAQEALNNAAKHSKASRVEVVLAMAEPGVVALEVSDDGLGIRERDRRKPESFGLEGMRERLRAFGGRLQVRRRVPSGTLIQALMPLDGDGQSEASSLRLPTAREWRAGNLAEGSVLRLLQRSNRQTLQSLIDALSVPTMVLDCIGRVQFVNVALTDALSHEGSFPPRPVAPGADFLEICHRASRADPAMLAVFEGLSQVLAGRVVRREVDYPAIAGMPGRGWRMEAVHMADGNVLVTHHPMHGMEAEPTAQPH